VQEILESEYDTFDFIEDKPGHPYEGSGKLVLHIRKPTH
jgi:hypothetical protein